MFLLLHLTLLNHLVDKQSVFDTIQKKTLKLFQDFNNEVKGISLKSIKTIRVSRDSKCLINEYNNYLYCFMFDMTRSKIV